MTRDTLRSLYFPAGVALMVLLSILQPQLFGTYGSFDLRRLITPCIQVIMFGMGATLSLADFARVVKMPRPVLIGFALQFSIMPSLGWLLAKSFGFDAEVAAGVILMGSVAGGVASNVITYLAGGNVPLSVTMTLCSTLAAPFATPLLMKTLAGRLVPINVGEMMLSIANMIVLPVVVGLVANLMLYGQAAWNRRGGPLLACAAAAAVITLGLAFLGSSSSGAAGDFHLGLILGFAFLTLMAFLKWLLNVRLGRTDPWLDRALPLVSMLCICFIVGIITSRARDQLLSMGVALLVAAMLHNLAGYFLGYWGARLSRLSESDCRTVGIEVGMQNAGMATGIAMNVLHSASAGLAAVVFGPWMNISGALLAAWWKRRPTTNQTHR